MLAAMNSSALYLERLLWEIPQLTRMLARDFERLDAARKLGFAAPHTAALVAAASEDLAFLRAELPGVLFPGHP